LDLSPSQGVTTKVSSTLRQEGATPQQAKDRSIENNPTHHSARGTLTPQGRGVFAFIPRFLLSQESSGWPLAKAG